MVRLHDILSIKNRVASLCSFAGFIRKPTVTRKITDDIEKLDPEADTSFDYIPDVNTENKEENGKLLFLNFLINKF